MNTGLRDKVILISGASGGIGQACARAFDAEGAKLALQGRLQMEALETLQPSLQSESLLLQADLTKERDVDQLFEQALARFGRVDGVVANAGIWVADEVPVARMSVGQWERTLAADQTSVFLCARAFFRSLQRTKLSAASLTIIGSSAAVFGEENHSDYAAAKAAITYGLTRSLKNEIVRIAPKGRVNAVCPGWTQTPMAKAGLTDEVAVNRAMQTRAIPKVAQPEDVAPLVVFLASDTLAGQITGQIITVAGGMEGRVLHKMEELSSVL